MKVTSNSWQRDAVTAYRTTDLKEDTENTAKGAAFPDMDMDIDMDTLDLAAESLAGLNSENKNSDFRMKASSPDNSVGQLASELSRAETRLDVQQVMSKAMKALASLKMAAYACEGEDAKKARQQIKRMEKLVKRIQKKLKHLGKEEQLENQRKQAQKQEQAVKEKQIREELRSRRKKRRRDEREYAMKEMNEDSRSQTGDLINSMMASLGGSSASPDLSALASSGGADLSAAMVDMGSIDISV